MSELLMSHRSVNTETIAIPISASLELYPSRKYPMVSASPIMSSQESVLSERTFAAIFSCIFLSHSCAESSRTVIV